VAIGLLRRIIRVRSENHDEELPESYIDNVIVLEEGQFSLPIEFDCNEFNT